MDLISRQVLCQYIDYRDLSAQKLADAVTHLGVPTSKATIGHLMSGHIKRTNPERAKKIAKVLGVPLGALFVDRVSTVQRDVPRSAA